ncbi:multicopper oxidase domain-containing protein [Methylocella sp.]|uniref:multicopper oxidase domain-containing protein n=1 Tax=Methylocella sp. TaxID=1978226 RepID=UPI0037850148
MARVDLGTVELKGRLDNGTTCSCWAFNREAPGPMIRVRVGDTVETHLKNAADRGMIHSVDRHAATGPGGGAHDARTDPGDPLLLRRFASILTFGDMINVNRAVADDDEHAAVKALKKTPERAIGEAVAPARTRLGIDLDLPSRRARSEADTARISYPEREPGRRGAICRATALCAPRRPRKATRPTRSTPRRGGASATCAPAVRGPAAAPPDPARGARSAIFSSRGPSKVDLAVVKGFDESLVEPTARRCAMSGPSSPNVCTGSG